jgi:cytochrome d ubiquinol oxidase subunit II
VLLGVVIGAIATGAVAEAADRIGSGSFHSVFVAPWLAPFPFAVGLFALVLFAFLAATYLTMETDDEALRNDFRHRALVIAIVASVLAAIVLALAGRAATRIAGGVAGSPALYVPAAACAVAAIAALWKRAYRIARLAAAAQVSLILWGWVLAQYPYIIPPAVTIRNAAAPAVTLRLLIAGVGIGAAVLLPSLRYLFTTFKSQVQSGK